MKQLFEGLSNREQSLLIWLAVFIIAIQFNRNIRKAFKRVIKAFFQCKVLLVCLFTFLYSSVIVLILWKINLWDVTLLKDSVFWFVGSAIVITFRLPKIQNGPDFFKKLLMDNFKLVVVLEFILNIHEFNLITELTLVPVITFLGMIQAYSEQKEEHKKLKVGIEKLFVVCGILLLMLSVFDIIKDFKEFASFSTVKSFLLPIILSTAFIPCAYFIALYMKYENIFVRLVFFLKNKKNLRYAKWRILWKCHFNLNKLNKMSSKINFLHRQSTREEIKQMIK